LKQFDLDCERERRKYERDKRKKERDFELKKIELTNVGVAAAATKPYEFRIDAAIKLVNKFIESDVETFFMNFEKIALINKWPKDKWSAIIQNQWIGKAAKAYARLTVAEASNYNKLKVAILKAYERVPQFYNQKFRSWYKKIDEAMHIFVKICPFIMNVGYYLLLQITMKN
jgi:hypothetical protein